MYQKYKTNKILIGIETKTRTELEFKSELIKKVYDWLNYKLYELHKKINYKYVEVQYQENIYQFERVA
tara:strand:- start:380 stop:583 length:204 start_codon:yes stop_codon:yes gene_type:complete